MAEESDARIKQLEKVSQESREQMEEMMELIRTLIKDKGQALDPSPQNETTQHDQKREDHVYPSGFTPPYAQAQPMLQMGGFPYGYPHPPTQTNEIGQNSEANTADPITIPDLDDPKE